MRKMCPTIPCILVANKIDGKIQKIRKIGILEHEDTPKKENFYILVEK